MMLIADSGSTKTTWMEVESGNMVVTEGLNPHFTSEETFLVACNVVRQQLSILNSQFSITFYGAGCGLPAQREKVATWLAKAFGASNVHVETDMLAACRATAGDQPALVAILGTGSNACLYDGLQISHQATSTGYILGDRGSANHVGRLLLNDYLTHNMPSDLRLMFHDIYHLSDAQLMDAVYHQPNPNRFLASLGRFAAERIDYTYCNEIIMESLNRWYGFQLIDFHIGHDYQDLYVVGGFAASIEPLLKRFANDHEITLRRVVADPIDGLRRFHRG